MNPLENAYLTIALCFLLVPTAVLLALAFPSLLFTAQLIVLAGALMARFITNRAVRTLAYLTLGFVSFWAAGTALYVPVGQEELLFSFLPFALLGIANATAALVAYNDGYMSGLVFASSALIAVLFTKGPLDFGTTDRFFISALIFTAASMIFARFASWSTRGASEASYNALKASFVSGALYGVIYVLRAFDIGMLNFADFGGLTGRVSPVLFGVWWGSLVPNFFAVAVALGAYELGLYVLELRRIVREDTVVFSRAAGAPAVEQDPFEPLVVRLTKFFEDYSKYDIKKASEVLCTLEEDYYKLAKTRESPLKAKAGKLIMEARGMLLGMKYEEAKAPAAASEMLGAELVEVPRGSMVLVEGPIGSRKEEFCLELMRRELQKGASCTVVSYEPEKEAGYMGSQEGLALVRVEQDINDIAIAISKALGEKPQFIFFNILYWILPNHDSHTVVDFIVSTKNKLKKTGATAIFVMEPEMLPTQVLTTIESVFDEVIEFRMAEKGGRPHSHYRIKEMKLRKFDPSWHEYG